MTERTKPLGIHITFASHASLLEEATASIVWNRQLKIRDRVPGLSKMVVRSVV